MKDVKSISTKALEEELKRREEADIRKKTKEGIISQDVYYIEGDEYDFDFPEKPMTKEEADAFVLKHVAKFSSLIKRQCKCVMQKGSKIVYDPEFEEWVNKRYCIPPKYAKKFITEMQK